MPGFTSRCYSELADEDRNRLENDHDAEGQNVASREVEHEARHWGADESSETESDFKQSHDDGERSSGIGVRAHGRVARRHAADAEAVDGGEGKGQGHAVAHVRHGKQNEDAESSQEKGDGLGLFARDAIACPTENHAAQNPDGAG